MLLTCLILVSVMSLTCVVLCLKPSLKHRQDPTETEKSFARRILSTVDYNEDGELSFSEFLDLIDAFGNQLAADKKEELFKAADKNGDGGVSLDELALLLAVQQEKSMEEIWRKTG